jgi:hypothetical protein
MRPLEWSRASARWGLYLRNGDTRRKDFGKRDAIVIYG